MEKKPFWTGPKRPSAPAGGNAGRRNNDRRRGGKNNDKDSHAINEQIRAREVRLVGDNVEEGIYPTQRALKIAEEQGMDLIEIAPMAQPPVCKIMDYQKFQYQQRKRLKEHAIGFLQEGCKVKSYVFFKGRSILFKEQGEVLLLRFANDLEEYGKVEQMPVLEGKRMTIMLSPKKAPAKKKDAPAGDGNTEQAVGTKAEQAPASDE